MKSKSSQAWLCRWVGFLAVAHFFLMGNSQAQNQLSTQSFKKGDAVRLIIWQPYRVADSKTPSLDINGEYLIDSRGAVFFPIIGEVRVVGHNTMSLADDLKEKLSPFFQDPVIVVEPLIRLTVIGAFRRPGTYLISPEASFWELINLAGGPDDNSNLNKMVVQRGGKVVKKNILSGFEKAYSLQEMGIYSGDQVFAPQKKEFRMKDAFEIVRFGISLLNLYLIITRL